MNDQVAIVRVHVTGPRAAVERLIENIEAAELPWLQVQDISDPTLMMGQSRRHLTVLVPAPEHQLVVVPSPFGSSRWEPGV